MKYCSNCGKEIPIVKEPEVQETEHKESEVINRVAGAVKSTFSQDRKKMKLYHQWIEYAGLPKEDIPEVEEGAPEAPVIKRSPGQQQRIPLIYMILGIAIIFFIIAIVIVTVTFISP